jgi:hypothetical protein
MRVALASVVTPDDARERWRVRALSRGDPPASQTQESFTESAERRIPRVWGRTCLSAPVRVSPFLSAVTVCHELAEANT